MKNLIHWFLQLSLGIVILFALMIALMTIIVDADDLKPSLHALAREHTGLILNIRKPLAFSLWTGPKLLMKDVEIAFPGSTGNLTLFTAKRCAISLWPWTGSGPARLAVDGLTMDADLVSREFSSTTPRLQALLAAPFFSALRICANSSAPRHGFHLKGIHITNATCTGLLTPHRTPSELKISELDIQGLGQGARAKAQCMVTWGNLALEVNGSLTFSGNLQTVLAKNIRADAAFFSPLAAGAPVKARLTGTFLVDLPGKRLALRTLRATLPGLDMLTSSTISWAGSSWEGEAIINANPSKVMGSLEAATANFKNLPAHLALRTHFALEPDGLDLDRVYAVMDGQTIHARATLTDFDRPDITFNIEGGHLDLTRYLDSHEHTGRAAPAWLKKARIQGNFSAKRILLNTVVAENPRAHVLASKGVVRISPLKACINNGTLEGVIRVNLHTRPPTTTLKTTIKKMHIRDLARTSRPSTALLGSMDIFSDLAWHGLPWTPDYSTAHGLINLDAGNGSLVGVNLPNRENMSRAHLTEDIIPFSALSARFDVNKGIVKAHQCRVKTGSTTLDGQGSYNLRTGELHGFFAMTGPDHPRQNLKLKGPLRQPHLHIVGPKQASATASQNKQTKTGNPNHIPAHPPKTPPDN